MIRCNPSCARAALALATVLLASSRDSAAAGPPKAAAIPVTVPPHEEPLIDVSKLDPKLLFDMRYATADNFFGKVAYPVARCALRRSIGDRMVIAQRWLEAKHPGLRLMFKDCYRPDRVQRVLWAAVKGTPQAQYVSSPDTPVGSIHSYGAAVDLTLADAAGKELDMGTPYDFLGPLAEPRMEPKQLRAGELTAEQVKNRRILRKAMQHVSMRMVHHEWWHFDGGTAKDVRKKYSRLDVPLEAITE